MGMKRSFIVKKRLNTKEGKFKAFEAKLSYINKH